MRRLTVTVTGVVVLAALGVTVARAAGVGRDAGATAMGGPGETVTVDVRIEHSRFTPSRLVVRRGTTVRFAVRNDDPIGHELIVGGPAVHARHEAGTEAKHPPRPGEVSVDPLGLADTTYTFAEPGRVLYACHLPGHFAYGMKGTVTVEAQR